MKLVLDLETLQCSRETWMTLTNRSGDGSRSPDDHAKEDEAYERSAFDGTFSSIICIGALLCPDPSTPPQLLAWYGDDEHSLLRTFWDEIKKLRPQMVIGHNLLGFDWPMLLKRSVIHQIKPSWTPPLARFRTEPLYDTMEIWANWDARARVSLGVLAKVLEVPGKTGTGADVAQLWQAGHVHEVATYCLHDTYSTYGVYSKMNFQSSLPFEAFRQSITEYP